MKKNVFRWESFTNLYILSRALKTMGIHYILGQKEGIRRWDWVAREEILFNTLLILLFSNSENKKMLKDILSSLRRQKNSKMQSQLYTSLLFSEEGRSTWWSSLAEIITLLVSSWIFHKLVCVCLSTPCADEAVYTKHWENRS